MPFIRNFDVFVEGADGQFITYGKQVRGNTVHTSIEAQDGVRFQIRIRPQHPFPEFKDEDGKPGIRPYKFCAFVKIDGNEHSDNSTMLPIRGECENYIPAYENGHVVDGKLCPRESTSSDGTATDLTVYPWVFTQKGIDVLLNQMSLSRFDPDVPKTSTDANMADLLDAMAGKNLSQSDEQEQKSGQIVVIFKRIVVAGYSKEWIGHPKSSQGDDNATHNVTIDKENVKHIRRNMYDYYPYDEDEEFHAKVVFHYHSLSKLVSLGLCSPDRKPIERLEPVLLTPPTTPGSKLGLRKRVRDVESQLESDDSDESETGARKKMLKIARAADDANESKEPVEEEKEQNPNEALTVRPKED